MSKGREKHQARLDAVSLLGKDLARRSGRKCELCETSGVSLSAFEVPPVPPQPDVEKCAFICDTCREQIQAPKHMNNDHWRCLGNSIWSTTPAVQALSISMLNRLDTDWAIDLKEMIFADSEIIAWSEQITAEI